MFVHLQLPQTPLSWFPLLLSPLSLYINPFSIPCPDKVTTLPQSLKSEIRGSVLDSAFSLILPHLWSATNACPFISSEHSSPPFPAPYLPYLSLGSGHHLWRWAGTSSNEPWELSLGPLGLSYHHPLCPARGSEPEFNFPQTSWFPLPWKKSNKFPQCPSPLMLEFPNNPAINWYPNSLYLAPKQTLSFLVLGPHLHSPHKRKESNQGTCGLWRHPVLEPSPRTAQRAWVPLPFSAECWQALLSHTCDFTQQQVMSLHLSFSLLLSLFSINLSPC